MNRQQTFTRKTLIGLMAVLLSVLAGVQSAYACHQDPCPTYCKGKWCE